MKTMLQRVRELRPGWMKMLILAACGAFCAAAELAGVFHGLELKTLDWRFRARDAVLSRLRGPGRPSPDIVLIEIDDESVAEIHEPFLLWDLYFAKVIEALTAAEPKVIAVDVVWQKSVEDFVELKGGSRRLVLARAMLRAARQGRLVLATHPAPATGRGQSVLSEAEGSGASALISTLGKEYAAAIGYDNMGIDNPLVDSDQEVRRNALNFPGAAAGGPAVPSFACLAARRYRAAACPERLVVSEAEPSRGALPAAGPILINYTTGPSPFARFRFSEVLARAAAGDRDYFARNFRGRLALIGSSVSSQDRHPSPLGKETPGLYIQAFAMRSLLEGRVLAEWGSVPRALAVLAPALAAGLATLRLAAGPGLSAAAAIALFYLAAVVVLFARGQAAPLAAPLIAAALAAAAVYVYRFAVEERDRRRTLRVLKRHVSDSVAEELLRNPEHIAPKGRRMRVAILFADIRGFTPFAENRAPEYVLARLNEYHNAMTAAIHARRGTLDKYIGDGLMAYFGAPLPDPQAARHAVQAGAAMLEKLAELNERWAARNEPVLAIGIGIHCGEAIVGSHGSRKRMDYGPIGDTVNVASRIEGLTKEYAKPMILSEAAFHEAQDWVEAEFLGESAIKGHSPVRVYAFQRMKPMAERGIS